MLLFSRVSDLQDRLAQQRQKGKSIGFVPTMGALHAGHDALVKKSLIENDLTVVSIFVNPTQFGPHEDLDQYPRQMEADTQRLSEMGVQICFHPGVDDMYPFGVEQRTAVHVPALSAPLCGQSRPHFFDGVCTVVLRLLNSVGPTRAYFGEKDYQQLQVIRRMVSDLQLTVHIVGVPIVREPDGLAMSSRNQYLSPDDRQSAAILYKTMQTAVDRVQDGESTANTIINGVQSDLVHHLPQIEIDYISIVDPHTLETVSTIEPGARLCLAVVLNGTRLIDNISL